MGGHAAAAAAGAAVEAQRAEHLARLLKACEGRDFTSRRDSAIILLLVDTGMCRVERVGVEQRIVWRTTTLLGCGQATVGSW